MTTSRRLAAALDHEDWTTRRAFMELGDAEKASVEAAFRRHFKACENNGLHTEPQFLYELIKDIRQGIHEPEPIAMAAIA